MSSTAEVAQRSLTVDDILAFLDKRGTRENWQLLDGSPTLMIGGNERHSLIAGSIYAALRGGARRRGCVAHIFDMLVTSADNPLSAAAPDVFVRCGPQDPSARKIFDPVIVVEVLSPSTMAFDRGCKITQYTTIPSLMQIICFVYPDEQARRKLDAKRATNGRWQTDPRGGRRACRSLRWMTPCWLSVIYEGIR